jgi:hypothetical protein
MAARTLEGEGEEVDCTCCTIELVMSDAQRTNSRCRLEHDGLHCRLCSVRHRQTIADESPTIFSFQLFNHPTPTPKRKRAVVNRWHRRVYHHVLIVERASARTKHVPKRRRRLYSSPMDGQSNGSSAISSPSRGTPRQFATGNGK